MAVVVAVVAAAVLVVVAIVAVVAAAAVSSSNKYYSTVQVHPLLSNQTLHVTGTVQTIPVKTHALQDSKARGAATVRDYFLGPILTSLAQYPPVLYSLYRTPTNYCIFSETATIQGCELRHVVLTL